MSAGGRLFHLVLLRGESAPALGRADLHEVAPPSLAREGFVHLSYAEQLAGTLAVHFAGAERVLLVEVELPTGEPALRVERSRGALAFPHLYRALAEHELARSWTLARGPDGAWRLPTLGANASTDAPPGHPLAPPGPPAGRSE